MSVRIRRIEAADLDRIEEIARASAQAPQWPRSSYRELAEGSGLVPRAGVVAVENDGSVVGFAAYSLLPQDASAEVESIAVHPGSRNRGAGSALLSACIEAGEQAGATVVRLEVRASNLSALALYRKQGFRCSGRRPGYYRDPEDDAITMERRLSAAEP